MYNNYAYKDIWVASLSVWKAKVKEITNNENLGQFKIIKN